MMLKGIAVSQGIAIGKAFIVQGAVDGCVLPAMDVATGTKLFLKAIDCSKVELEKLRDHVAMTVGSDEAAVFEAQMMMLDDSMLLDSVQDAIQAGSDVVTAIQQTIDHLVAIFKGMDDDYMQERAADIMDIGRRILRHVTGNSGVDLSTLAEPCILVAHDLTPSETAQLDVKVALGFVVEVGGRTSHSAIFARTLAIPAVVGAAGIMAAVQPGDTVIIDGTTGFVAVNPDSAILAKYHKQAAQEAAVRKQLKELKELSAETIDKHQIEIAANIGSLSDVEPAIVNGAAAVGLYRTEFLFLGREDAPTEEEQFQAYKAVVEAMDGRPIVIRTLDVGGDKQISYLNMPKEDNPFLGYRAIRMCLDRVEFFKIQLKALWRAGYYGPIKVMFPMISSLDEVRQAKALLAKAREELVAQGQRVATNLSVGIMVEIPAAAVLADMIAAEVDFFSIGSNDLIQYTLAVDRMNESIASLYDPLHPSVLRLISMVIDAAHKQGKWVGMCGEMAGDLSCIPILLGLGLDEFSMSGGGIPAAKQLIRSLSYEDCRDLAGKCLQVGTSADVRKLSVKKSKLV